MYQFGRQSIRVWHQRARSSSFTILVTLTLISLASSLVLPSARPALAIAQSAPWYARPSLWAPTPLYAEMGYEGYGNVFYQFQWDLERNPSSLFAWENVASTGAESLEIGYKPTGGDNCRRLAGGLNGTFGIPPGVYVGPDFTEDTTDAVLFVGDMSVLAADQRANRTRAYGAWWSCDGPFNPAVRPTFNVQMGDGDRPLVSDSKAQMTYVPAEQGARGFPATNPSPGAHTSTGMHGPWTVDWNFEDGSQPWKNGDDDWFVSNAIKTRKCNQGAIDGVCFESFRPATLGVGLAWLYQGAYVANSVAPEGQPFTRLDIGTNTGFQYEGMFRCPSPANIGVCGVDVWLKGTGRAWDPANDRRTYNIPADNQWYYVLRDDFPAGGATTSWELWIGSFASEVQVDSQWVTSGL